MNDILLDENVLESTPTLTTSTISNDTTTPPPTASSTSSTSNTNSENNMERKPRVGLQGSRILPVTSRVALLGEAAMFVEPSVLQWLLDRPNESLTAKEYTELLSLAVMGKRPKIVELLLSVYKVNPLSSTVDGASGYTLAQQHQYHLQQLQKSILKNPNVRDSLGTHPTLMHTTKNLEEADAMVAIFKKYIDSQSDVIASKISNLEKTDVVHGTGLVKLIRSNGSLDEVKKWVGDHMDAKFNFALYDQELPPLIEALEHRRGDIAKYLIETIPKLQVGVYRTILGFKTPLLMATRNGDFETVKLLLEKGADPNTHTKHGITPLMFAIIDRETEIAKLIINHRSTDFSLKDGKGVDAWHFAARYGNVEIAKELHAKGVNVNSLNSLRQTALIAAVSSGHIEHVKFLISIPELDINHIPENGTALMLALRRRSLELAEIILSRKDVSAQMLNARDEFGETVLTFALRMDFERISNFLLQHPEVDVNVCRKPSETSPIMLAVKCSFDGFQSIATMLEKGAAPAWENADGESVLSFALKRAATSKPHSVGFRILEFLLSKKEIFPHEMLISNLWVAAESGILAFEPLIKAVVAVIPDFDVNRLHPTLQTTILERAVLNQQIPVIEHLLKEFSSKINLFAGGPSSAFRAAIQYDRPEIVRLFLMHSEPTEELKELAVKLNRQKIIPLLTK